MESNPNILAGRPELPNPAAGSFTRFVLPFAYHPEEDDKTSDPTRFFVEARSEDWLHGLTGDLESEDDPSDLQRRDYLTRETALVLHRRARWFALREPVLETGRSPERLGTLTLPRYLGGRVTAIVRPPGLVLFEWPEEPGSGRISPLQTGFLVFEVYFQAKSCPKLSHLLALNELFRYWKRPFRTHSEYPAAKAKGQDGPPAYKNYREVLGDLLFAPKADRLRTAQEEALRLYLDRWSDWLHLPVESSGKRWRLVSDDALKRADTHALGTAGSDPGWAFYADNRAYVWTCAVVGEEAGAKLFTQDIAKWQEMDQVPKASGAWVKLLNADPPSEDPSRQNDCTSFEARWADERTYRRWADCSALYGFCYHAAAMLTAPSPPKLPTRRHFRELYFDQALLVFYIRCTLFRFSEELALLSARVPGNADPTGLSDFEEHFETLRLRFTVFTNLYQFPLISNQQQAVEMYVLLRKSMDVQELYAEIKSEIENTHEFLAGLNERKIGRVGMRLTYIATIGLLWGLFISYFQADFLRDAVPWLRLNHPLHMAVSGREYFLVKGKTDHTYLVLFWQVLVFILPLITGIFLLARRRVFHIFQTWVYKPIRAFPGKLRRPIRSR